MTEQSKERIVEVDMRGQVCPSTLLVAMDNLNRHSEDLNRGLVELCIKTDNREATNTVPGMAESMGFSSVITKREGYYEIMIQSSTVEL